MKKLLAPIALAAVLAMTGCGAANTTSKGTAGTKATEAAEVAETEPQIPDLTGAWKSPLSDSGDSYQQGTISADAMTIDWASDGGDTTSIYWVGTFEEAPDATEPYTWVSQRDVAATEFALMASTDDTKEFTYQNGTISYKVSALGTTKTAKLTKN